ncbi:transcriptional regulator, GntR family [Longilinea arvoryzae]|uniref:Transcriptional regulator, GntR family n=1 Tax=Longilinea arvoryzae TaxID=360412 RepID=A0A0S7BFP5_9CHLR|nr:PLP-dependent aminotransferase family protein [Longilinea arvoryzae]GAP13318.1 transcriptional regulator, GntR family [Longilinea arvoryzae]
MRIPIDRNSEIPLYRQIEQYFRQAILSGSLTAQTRLPASRTLAHDLGVNRITIETAYGELEADGLVYTHPGSGVYVLPMPAQPARQPAPIDALWPLWQQELALQPAEASPRVPAASPGCIDFSPGGGASDLFPVEEFRKVLQNILRREGNAALEYGDPCGYVPLRATIAQVLASQGLQTSPDNVLITSGSQQAIALVCQTLLRPGDCILVEAPTYASGLELFHGLGLKVIGVPLDENGLQMDALETALQQHHPRLIYTIPNFHNPTGVCLSAARRRTLLELSRRHNAAVLEDDFVGDLRYEGRALPTLKSLDPGGQVIYVSTFSKMLMPGLRVGFMVADGPALERLARLKRTTDLATSSFIQRALENYVTIGRYQAHLRRSCLLYRRRRDAALQAVRRWLPEQTRWTAPQGGLFLWLRLPPGMDSARLLPLALSAGVSFAPGRSFFADGCSGAEALRLNFTLLPPEQIDEGIQRLARALDQLSRSD